MNADQLKAYKRDKSKKFNAHLRDLRLKEKKRIADNQPDQQPDNQGTAQGNQPDELSLQDLMDIYETLDTKMDIIQNKLENKLENKIDELFNRLDTIESIIETKLETKLENKLETNTLLPQFKPIFFA